MITPDLSANDFAQFFAAVHGVRPFPWQDRLLQRIAAQGEWPKVLDLPTGSGKTAALDIAVFHLAVEASRGPERRAPLRIAFVVDRRLVVDDAHARATRIADALAWSLLAANDAEALRVRLGEEGKPDLVEFLCRVRAEPLVGRVASQLGRLAERGDRPLLARRLRGGMPREDDWARTPCQPTILCSTVDQVGSRLLFRGYGISDRMKPVHAGLLGSDCLILLDEAHLAEPFHQTLTRIARLRARYKHAAPWRVALLSATPGEQLQKPFSLADEDYDHPVLARRIGAAKPAALIEIAARQGVAPEDRRIDEIVVQSKDAVAKLRRALPSPALGVVVNRVTRARRVFERLKDEVPDAEVILIIGPARGIEREELAARELQPIRTGKARTLDLPLIVVATQAIEAGVDLDFDGLVTEAAALDALRQRFGRVNRAGRDIRPVASILAHKEDIGSRADDAVYGDRISKTWDALMAVAAGSPEPLVEFGIAEFPRQLIANSHALSAEKEDAPVLLPAYADLWSQTSPVPNADPEVSLFLHGRKRSPASVQVVWRADIAIEDLDDRNRLAALLDLVPPRVGEAIEIPLWAARSWLRRDAAAQQTLSDIAERAPEETGGRGGRRAFRYAGSDDALRTRAVFADELQNGDVIVVPATYGGCDQWGWAPDSIETVVDLAEKAAGPYARRRFAARITPELIEQWVLRSQRETDEVDAAAGASAAIAELTGVLAAHRDDAASELLDTVLDLPIPKEIKASLELLNHRRGRRLERVFAYADDIQGRPRGVVFLARRGIRLDGLEAGVDQQCAAPATEDDLLGSIPGFAQPLDEHSIEVQNLAAAFASAAGIAPEIADDVALAAYLHDAGKADPRFQAMLYGGDWFAVDERTILAKSAARVGPDAWAKSGLPDNWRHEALSVRLAREHSLFKDANDKELVLWLIGVHHGYGRPLFPHADEDPPTDLPDVLGGLKAAPGPGPQSLAFSFEGWDWPQIFERLKGRYGIWELARMEAIVRLADHRASEAADTRGGEDATS